MSATQQENLSKRLVSWGIAKTIAEAETLIATHGETATGYALEAIEKTYQSGRKVSNPAAYFRKCAAAGQTPPPPPAPARAAMAATPREEPKSAAYVHVKIPRPRPDCPVCHGGGYVILSDGRLGGLCRCAPAFGAAQ